MAKPRTSGPIGNGVLAQAGSGCKPDRDKMAAARQRRVVFQCSSMVFSCLVMKSGLAAAATIAPSFNGCRREMGSCRVRHKTKLRPSIPLPTTKLTGFDLDHASRRDFSYSLTCRYLLAYNSLHS